MDFGASLPVPNPALAIKSLGIKQVAKPPCSSFLICKMGILVFKAWLWGVTLAELLKQPGPVLGTTAATFPGVPPWGWDCEKGALFTILFIPSLLPGGLSHASPPSQASAPLPIMPYLFIDL